MCFTSEEEKRIAAEGFPGHGFRGVVIPYGTPGPSGDPNALKQAFVGMFPALRGKPYLLFLGRIHEKKGCDLLIEAFAQAAPKELALVMAGPDEVGLRPRLEELVQRFGVADRVYWTGMLTGDPKWGAICGAEAFVLPSHQENFGIAVADALACGTIPLLSDKVNIAWEVASDGAALVEPDTLEGTRRLIERFNALSPETKADMRSRGFDCHSRRYALANSAAELYKAMGIG